MIASAAKPRHAARVEWLHPSQTSRGSAWLTNFSQADRPAARLLLDGVEIADPTTVRTGIRRQLDRLGELNQDSPAVLLPVLSVEDIERPERFYGPHVAYQTFQPGDRIAVTPGSEAAVGNLVRDLTGARPGRERGGWLHPATTVDELHLRRCRRVVLVTDYSGSGTQAQQYADTFTRHPRIRSWRSFGWLRIAVVAYAASASAQRVMEGASSIDDVLVARPASSFETAKWTDDERQHVIQICHSYLNSRQRRHKGGLGYKGSAGLFAMHTGVPNNVPEILRTMRNGWHPFFDGRVFPADLAAELGTYSPSRQLEPLVEAAGQARVARAIRSGRIRTPSDSLVAILALIAHRRQTITGLAHELSEPEDLVRRQVAFLTSMDLVTEDLVVTPAGAAELHAAKRLNRATTPRLWGSNEIYYPTQLR